MKIVSGIALVLAGIFLLVLPASAAENHEGSCTMHSGNSASADSATESGSRKANGTVNDPSIEEIPSGAIDASAGEVPCPLHNTSHKFVCDSLVSHHCNMLSGCCIKGEGPLSSGAKEQSVGEEDDLGLTSAFMLSVDQRFAYLRTGDSQLLERTYAPVPRPPSV